MEMNTPEEFQEALSRLPHGPEFRFVDEIVSLHPGKSGIGWYTIRGDEEFLRGHFPEHPLMPGVLLIEAAAQLAGVVAQCDPELPPLPGLKLTAVRAAKITGSAGPGVKLVITADISGRLGRLVQATCSIRPDQPGWGEILSTQIVLSGDEESADS